MNSFNDIAAAVAALNVSVTESGGGWLGGDRTLNVKCADDETLQRVLDLDGIEDEFAYTVSGLTISFTYIF